jgi:Apea-like HEPN
MGILRLQPDKRIEFLPRVVEHLESLQAFRQLVNHTQFAFPDQFHTRDASLARQAARHFFRRCAFYLNVFEGKDIGIEMAFGRYVKAFQKRDIAIRRLTLLDGIDFVCPDSCISFGKFQIRRFSHEELAAILGNRVNQVFYPSATIDVKRLQGYWFLSTTSTQSFPQPDDDDSVLRRLGSYLCRRNHIDPEYEGFAKLFGTPEQILALFPWHKHLDPQIMEDEWGRFMWPQDFLPFTFEVNCDLLSSPQTAPDLSLLQLKEIFDPTAGEEIGKERVIWFDVDKEGTCQFKCFVRYMEDLLHAVKPQECGWEFLEVAMGYFMKAFRSSGLEQLLWNITVIESLLGEDSVGLKDRLARGLSTILGNTKHEQEDVRKRFRDLYDFRCDLVHGNKFKKQVFVKHLSTARLFARDTLVWFLHYLYAAQPSISDKQATASVPSRHVLLMNLDMDKSTREPLRLLMDRLPPEFPNVQGWRE